jgi:hypothetical protein
VAATQSAFFAAQPSEDGGSILVGSIVDYVHCNGTLKMSEFDDRDSQHVTPTGPKCAPTEPVVSDTRERDRPGSCGGHDRGRG